MGGDCDMEYKVITGGLSFLKGISEGGGSHGTSLMVGTSHDRATNSGHPGKPF